MVFHNLYKLFIQTFLTLFQQYRYAYRVPSRFSGCGETGLAKKKSGKSRTTCAQDSQLSKKNLTVIVDRKDRLAL